MPEKYQTDKYVRGGSPGAYLGERALCHAPPPLLTMPVSKKEQN